MTCLVASDLIICKPRERLLTINQCFCKEITNSFELQIWIHKVRKQRERSNFFKNKEMLK